MHERSQVPASTKHHLAYLHEQLKSSNVPKIHMYIKLKKLIIFNFLTLYSLDTYVAVSAPYFPFEVITIKKLDSLI